MEETTLLSLFSKKLKNFSSFLQASFHIDASQLLNFDPVYIASLFYLTPELYEFRQKQNLTGLVEFLKSKFQAAAPQVDPLSVPLEDKQKLWLYLDFFQEISQELCGP